jgi:hypothetical protein
MGQTGVAAAAAASRQQEMFLQAAGLQEMFLQAAAGVLVVGWQLSQQHRCGLRSWGWG